MNKRIAGSIACILFYVVCLGAISADFHFSVVDKNRIANQFYQSNQGQLYLATNNGLFKMNGDSLSPLFHETKKAFLGDGKSVHSIFSSEQESTWFISYGISSLGKTSKTLELYPQIEELIHGAKFYLGRNQQNEDLIAGTNGFVHVKNGKVTKSIILNKADPIESKLGSPISFSEAGDFYLIGFAEGGLLKLDLNKRTFFEIKVALPFSSVYRILEIDTGKFFLGTDTGLWEFDSSNEAFRNYNKQIKGEVVEIIRKSEHEFLIAAKGIYHILHDVVTTIDSFSGVSRFEDNQLSSLFIDREETVWASLKRGGVFKSTSSSTKVQSFKLMDGIDASVNLRSDDLLIERDFLYVGNPAGLYRFNLKTESFSKNLLKENEAIQKLTQKNGGIYVASKSNIWELRDEKTTLVSNLNWEFPSALNVISAIFLDTNNNIWVGAYGFEKSEVLKIVRAQKNSHRAKTRIKQEALLNDDIHFMVFVKDINAILVSYYARWSKLFSIEQDLVVFDERVRGFIQYNYNVFKSGDKLYFASEKGAFAYTHWDEKLGNLATYTKLQTPVNNAQCLIETAPGEYWLAQKNGSLFFWNSHTDALTEYDAADGLSPAGLTGKSCLEHPETGKLYFAANDGIVVVDPDNIPTNHVQPSIYLENMQISGAAVDNDTNNISYQHDQELQFTLRVDSYAVPSENRIKTRLRGLNQWTEVPASQNKVSYSQLASGDYTFEAMGSNNDGVWSEPITLKFTVLPPWWRSQIALVIYAFVLLTLMFVLFKWRTRTLQIRAKVLEQTVNQRTNELANEKQRVEALLEQKNNEFANVSHEFRTPLTLIYGPISKMLSTTDKEQDRQTLSMVQRNTQRLVRMVDQILYLERHKLKQVAEKQVQDVSGLVELVYQCFVSLAEEKSITMDREIEPNLRVELAVDSLDKIVINLVSNAIKYTPEGGSITLKAFAESGQVVIEISDTGVGIPEDMQAEVFNKFSRVLDANSEKITGAGIGLSLVKELVESQQGTIELRSDYGSGSCFTVRFPLIDTDSSQAAQLNKDFIDYELGNLANNQPIVAKRTNEEAEKIEDSSLPLVLVIEDNQDMREYIVSSLAKYYRCIEAENGKIGVEKAKQTIPDLIISDVMMPEMDGFEVSNHLKTHQLTSHIPIILLTARGDKKSRIRGWREHADEYLTKPFDADELLIRIENLLAIRDMIRQRYQAHIQSDSLKCTSTTGMEGFSDEEGFDAQFIDLLYTNLETIYQNSDVSVDTLAEKMSCSSRQLQRKIAGLLNLTPSQLLREYRLNRSAELLSKGHKPNVIYLETGFSSHSYFSRCFKAKFGCSPSEYATRADKVS